MAVLCRKLPKPSCRLPRALSHIPRRTDPLPTSAGISGRRDIVSSAVWPSSLPVVLEAHLSHRCRRTPVERDVGPWNELVRASSSGARWRPAATWAGVERCRTCWPSTTHRPRRRRQRQQGSAAAEQKTVRRRTIRPCRSFCRRRQSQSANRFLRISSTTSHLTRQIHAIVAAAAAVVCVRDLELHLASRMTDRRCRPLWPWNEDHVTGRRWLDRPRLTVGRQTLSGCRAARTGCY